MPDQTPDEAAALDEALATLTNPSTTPSLRLSAVSIARREVDELRAELDRTTVIGRDLGRQVRSWSEEADSLRARLAAQQPVIDAAGAQEARVLDLLRRCEDEDEEVTTDAIRAALSGSVEAADTPPSGTSGHEADTPAEPEWKRRQRGVRTALFGTDEEVQAALAERRAAAEPDDECPACAAANRPRPMRDLAAILRVDAALPDAIDVGNAVAYCAYTQARDALRAAIGIVAQLAPTLDAREVAGTPAAEPAPDVVARLTAARDAGRALAEQMYRGHPTEAEQADSWRDALDDLDYLATVLEGPHDDIARAIVRALAGAGAPTEPADDTQETDHG